MLTGYAFGWLTTWLLSFVVPYHAAWVAGWVVWAPFLVRATYFFILRLWGRLGKLSWTPASMPAGHVRRVAYDPREPVTLPDGRSFDEADAAIAFDEWETTYWAALSAIIVPYEQTVVFVDKRVDPAGTEAYILSSQEKQHGLIHGKFNRAHLTPEKTGTRAFVMLERCIDVQATLLRTYLPWVIDGMVGNFEHSLYYSLGVERLFAIFDPDGPGVGARSKALCKIFLWHLAEEREHCEESTALFRKHYGTVLSRVVILIGLPAVLFLLSQPTIVALYVMASTVGWQPRLLAEAVWGFIARISDDDASLTVACLLMLLATSSKDDDIREQIALYRERFQAMWGTDLGAAKFSINTPSM